MSIWSSLGPASGHRPHCGDINQCDEYGDRNPRDHVIDVATAYSQIRLSVWAIPQARQDMSMCALLPLGDAKALRDLLSSAIDHVEEMQREGIA